MAQKSLEELFWETAEGWAFGMKNYPGEIYPELVYQVVKEFGEDIRLAIRCELILDLMKIHEKFTAAAKYLVPEKELAFNILAQLPKPSELRTENQLFALAQAIDSVEKKIPGAIERLERKWGLIAQRAA
jgi:hypothetical protein